MTLPRPLVLALACALLGAGILTFQRRQAWLATTTAAAGTVEWTTRYQLGIRPPDETLAVTVRRPLLHLYRRGQSVRIRWNPRDHYPGRLRPSGRVDSFAGLWLTPLLWLGAGALVLLVYLTRGRVTVRYGRSA